MNRNKIIWFFASLCIIVSASCKKDFLEEKRDLNGENEQVFKDPVLAQSYVDYMYYSFQPGDNAAAFSWELAHGDAFSRTTEEFAGQTDWNRVWSKIDYNQNHASKYFGEKLPTGGPKNNPYTRIKQINIFLSEIDKYGLPEKLREELKGQMLFWRAFQYFDLVRLYGGVPLILEPQNPIVIEGAASIEVPRSKSSEVIEQIVADLDAATEFLPPNWGNSDWGRITSGGAAALKGRVLLTWASPQFNRNDDRARWQRAYDANLAAKNLLEASGFGLYKKGSLANATAWEKMFFEEYNNPEAVIITGFNSVISDQVQKNNGWEQAARPREIEGAGSLSPTKQIMDAFPMKDGKDRNSSTYTYDPNKFYKNRDPRFYKTFAYNGSHWPFNEDKNYRLWTYSWFSAASKATPDKTTETAGSNSSGIYIRKGTNPDASNSRGDFGYSGTDFMEMRFAEVVLNLAESAIGIDKLSEGLTLIKSIRERAGVENLDLAYGLSNVVTRDQHFAAAINERKIEFAFEGKRFWDLRRWMLFDDEFGTLTRLGMDPLNGTRRTGIWIYVKKDDGSKYVEVTKPDPTTDPKVIGDPMLVNSRGVVPVISREPAAYPPGITTFDEYLDYLYDNHFVVIEKDNLDPTNNNWKFKWYKEYYFLGINKSILDVSPYLEQTQGWNSVNGAGTFDPLQ
ncbi:RagB/SusD family nutrient uptake outer membrane protein [Paradesertivirga mongoliensis]|uniref:RagB/SusD family nutrient uptake outer membrane protein n=1 Tax=Paradesertivirga mongoliensis TaxID=2100740 RepID=A0ABW4ZP19_9SPHI|nr:RagB/SusD family nutrient uptake outer membrane protein [Pedobacter mongoliensis]